MTGQEKISEIIFDGDLPKDDLEIEESVTSVTSDSDLHSFSEEEEKHENSKPEINYSNISDKIRSILSKAKASDKIKTEIKRLYLKLNEKMAIKGGEIIYTIIALYVRACFHQGTGKTLAQVVRIFKDKYPELTIRKLRKVYNSVKLI